MSNSKAAKPTHKDVDACIAGAPTAVRSMLRELRAAIKEAAPDAIERIA
jgi:uncharacterized protein YdhG (YjbR/CyaY superfamily)